MTNIRQSMAYYKCIGESTLVDKYYHIGKTQETALSACLSYFNACICNKNLSKLKVVNTYFLLVSDFVCNNLELCIKCPNEK